MFLIINNLNTKKKLNIAKSVKSTFSAHAVSQYYLFVSVKVNQKYKKLVALPKIAGLVFKKVY